MTSQPTRSAAQQIIDNVGGAQNVSTLTHCATRLRFELNDASKVNQAALDATPGVLGALPQSGDRYQVVIGGAVTSVYNEIMALPSMASRTSAGAVADEASDADVKAAARAKVRGRNAWVDNFFEYLADSFRPLIGVLLGASLIIAIASVLDALHIVDFRSGDKAAGWVFVDAMWHGVFFFLPIMVAYNAAKKLKVDPWLGAVVMGALMTPEFTTGLRNSASTVVTKDPVLGTDIFTANIFGVPMSLPDYSGNVFVPLIMVAVLALVYRGLKRIFPESVQLVFVPFLSMSIMIPLTAFLIGPAGLWMGTTLGSGLAWMNSNAPFVFAILIPMLYPFLVPLGLHWPLNALMLANINTLGYDFIQGPMGAWNFACFGATAGVLYWSVRDRDRAMRQTATGALLAGLFGGISEPSLYGIHLRFKRIYPRMLAGCLAGGLTIAILGAPFDGVKTGAFAFTSLLTIPVFSPMWVYGLSVAVAFFVAFFAIVLTGYRTKEERALALAAQDAAPDAAAPVDVAPAPNTVVAAPVAGATAAAGTATLTATDVVLAPLAGEVVPVGETSDKVFASKALGEGVGIRPAATGVVDVVAPVAGTVKTVAKTGHAFGIKTDDGVEVLVHVGIDTVKMAGEGFTVAVAKGARVAAGDVLGTVDLGAVARAGFEPTTIVTVTNTAQYAGVTPRAGAAAAGDTVLTIQR